MPVKKKVTSKKPAVISSEARNLKIKKAESRDSSPSAQNDNRVSPIAKRASALSISVYSLAGKETGTMSLPKEIFGGRVNKRLLAQALRVYMNNQKSHPGSTKTRGEVKGSTAKIYRQKGTGRARHGAKKAPIFVGGGIVFGPTPRKVRLELPKKMKKAALLSALADKAGDKGVFGITGLEKITGKTTEIAGLIRKIREITGNKGSALFVTGEKMDSVVRGVRNIQGVDVLPTNQLNAYEVLKHSMLLMMKDSISALQNDKGEKPK